MLKKVFYSIFGLCGVAALCAGSWLMAWGALSTQWPSTTGRILSAGITSQYADTPTTYGAAASYEYFIASQRYISDRISFGNYSSGDSGHARQILSRYPIGTTVSVFYNPARPSMSVLERGVGGGAYIILAVGAAFAGFVLIMRLAEKQDADLVSAARLDPDKAAIVFRENQAQPGGYKKRIEVSRDGPRVQTNYPPYAIILGVIFLTAGLALAIFGAGEKKGSLLVILGLFIAIAGGSLAWHAMKGLRLRNLRNQASGRSPWHYDYPWDRQATSDDGFRPAVRVLYAVVMIAAFLAPLQLLMFKQASGERVFLSFVFGLFDIALAAGLGRALYLFVRAFKFGRNRIVFHSFPLLTGQDATVTFVADKRLRNQALHAELQCICEYYESSGSAQNRSSFPVFELLYSQTSEFRTDSSGISNLTFHVPANAVSTDLIGTQPCYWELEISAKLPGIDYRGIFLMPVYKI